MSYKVGADPEVFVENTDGIIVPVIGLLGGTKEMPLNCLLVTPRSLLAAAFL